PRFSVLGSCSKDLDVMFVKNSASVVILDVVDNLAHHFIGISAVVAGAGDANRQRLPAILVRYLGDGNVETAADALHQRAAYLAFSLQAVVFGQVEDELARSEERRVGEGW